MTTTSNNNDNYSRAEYDEQEEFKKKKMPWIYEMPRITDNNQQKNLVIKNEDFEIYDLFYRAPDADTIIGTSIFVKVSRGLSKHGRAFGVEKSSTRPPRDLVYFILQGKGEIITGDYPKIVSGGQTFVMQEGIKHNISNSLDDTDLIYSIYYPGYYDIREVYFPMQKKFERAKESKNELFKQQPQMKEEKKEKKAASELFQ